MYKATIPEPADMSIYAQCPKCGWHYYRRADQNEMVLTTCTEWFKTVVEKATADPEITAQMVAVLCQYAVTKSNSYEVMAVMTGVRLEQMHQWIKECPEFTSYWGELSVGVAAYWTTIAMMQAEKNPKYARAMIDLNSGGLKESQTVRPMTADQILDNIEKYKGKGGKKKRGAV